MEYIQTNSALLEIDVVYHIVKYDDKKNIS